MAEYIAKKKDIDNIKPVPSSVSRLPLQGWEVSFYIVHMGKKKAGEPGSLSMCSSLYKALFILHILVAGCTGFRTFAPGRCMFFSNFSI